MHTREMHAGVWWKILKEGLRLYGRK